MINKLKSKSEFSSNAMTLMSGTVIAQALPLVITPILTRLYSPTDFGIFAIFVAIVGIFSVVATARYEQAIMLPDSHDEAISLIALSVIMASILSFTLALFIWIFFDFINSNTHIGYWLYGVPFGVLLVSIFNSLIAMNNRLALYKDIATSTVLKATVLAISQLMLGFMSIGFAGLILGFLGSSIAANQKLLHNIRGYKLKNININIIKKLANKYRNFPIFQAPHALLNTLVTYIPVYLFAPFFGTIAVGLYSLSNRVIFMPLSILANSNAKVYNQHITTNLNEQPQARYDFTVLLLKKFSLILIVPFVVFVVFAPDIFSFVFGKQWMVAGLYAQILSPWFFLNSLVSIIAYIPSMMNEQKKALKIAISHAIIISLAISFGIYLGDIKYALALFAIAQCTVLLYNLIWMLSLIRENK
jgi:O-antigen/teichoic acid export membrane protein